MRHEARGTRHSEVLAQALIGSRNSGYATRETAGETGGWSDSRLSPPLQLGPKLVLIQSRNDATKTLIYEDICVLFVWLFREKSGGCWWRGGGMEAEHAC